MRCGADSVCSALNNNVLLDAWGGQGFRNRAASCKLSRDDWGGAARCVFYGALVASGDVRVLSHAGPEGRLAYCLRQSRIL